jgi:hypothetical protein
MDNRTREEFDMSILDEAVEIPEVETAIESEELDIEEEIQEEEEVAPTPQKPKEEVKVQPLIDTPEVDYKEKYTESTREAQALFFKNQKLTETIGEADSMSEPTAEELKAYARVQGAEYDDLDTFSQNILKRTFINEKKFDLIKNVANESKKIDEWSKKVDNFIEESIDNSSYPSLNSLGTDFKKFSMKESRRGLDLNDLVSSFLYNNDKAKKNDSPSSVLLSGGNSQAAPIKPAGLNENDIAIIRQKNPREYKRMIKSGEIDLEI